MNNKKTIRDVAIVVIVVFLVTVVVYPLIFGTDQKPKDQPAVELEVHK